MTLYNCFEVNIIMNTTTMALLPEGCTAVVTELCGMGSMRRRLMDMGLIKGTKIECLHRSPSGDPCAYLIRGAVIALRKSDTSEIKISLPE